MDRFFNMDNKFFTFMSRVADLIILNLLCIVCCIPVVTIGPSIAAMFYVTLKMVRNEESYIVRGFFKSFKQNLKQGIVINLIMLAAALLQIFKDVLARPEDFDGTGFIVPDELMHTSFRPWRLFKSCLRRLWLARRK